jgi:hypothetical protein
MIYDVPSAVLLDLHKPERQKQFPICSAIDGKNGLHEYHNQNIKKATNARAIAIFRNGPTSSSGGHSLHPCVVITPDTLHIPHTGPLPLLLHTLPARQLPDGNDYHSKQNRSQYEINTMYQFNF